MKNIVLFIFCVAVIAFQLSFAGEFFQAQRIPDMAMAIVISLVLAFGFRNSIGWILFSSAVVDSYSLTVFGTMTLIFFLIAWIVSRLPKIADIRSKKTLFLVSLAIIVAAAEAFKDLIILGIANIGTKNAAKAINFRIDFFSFDYFLKIAYTVLAAFLVYYILRKMSRTLFLSSVKLPRTKY